MIWTKDESVGGKWNSVVSCVSTGDVGTMQNQYALHYSGTSLIRAPMGQKKVSFLG